ncbi:glycosyl hydrolase [Alteromonas pelagimontana]|uniref:Glycosyl hydrolase n=1 Tax=Alteromonas pelagimontana TaxID=1858656 RepID=A0A6M4MJR9_9ALTE|nr:glycosyl hydrolase [Alteromonas pelagimontana]
MVVLLLLAFSASANASNYLTAPGEGAFALVSQEGAAAPLIIDVEASAGLRRAVTDLQNDIQRVTGLQPLIESTLPQNAQQVVIIGELGRSKLLAQLIAAGKLNVEGIAQKWDGYLIQHLRHPFEGVEQAWIIAGADKRGAIYGSYDISETIGVSPWYWWADVPVIQKDNLYLAADTRIEDFPRVKYRGIFLNDEAPALTSWSQEKFGGYNAAFYEHVFELLLRLKGNFLWPAMWNNAFADDDPQNAVLADEMGIVMSTSHHEPMMRADKEWNRYGEGKWEYSTNPDNLAAFWEEGAKRYQHREGVFTLGMRGQEDTPMSEGENVALLEKVVADQRAILAKTFTDRPLADVPQVWTLYKEVQGFYERGMRVPEDVTLLWSDDNFGNIRRLPTKEERSRKGGAGVYYHFDYVGGPRSYRWINTVPLGKVYEQMSQAYEYGARTIWVTNVGDLKPMELPIDFFLSMAWNPTRFNGDSPKAFTEQWAAQQFGSDNASTVSSLLNTYTLHNGRRKPEALEPDTYSIDNYNEASRVAADLQAASAIAAELQQSLSAQYQSSFFQLVGYPLWASQAVFELNRHQALNARYAAQQRALTNDMATATQGWFKRDAELTARYHQLKEGRWNGMMSQPHIGYVNWRNPPANIPPVLHTKALAQPAVADMGVTVAGAQTYWPANEYSDEALQLDRFTFFGESSRSITIYNRQSKPFTYRASTSAPWVQLSEQTGSVTDSKNLAVSIDWAALPAGVSKAQVSITGTGWGGATVNVVAEKPETNAIQSAGGFVEADGYISMPASDGRVKQNTDASQWQRIELLGRTGSAMRAWQAADKALSGTEAARPYLEFPLTFFSTGEHTVDFYLSPSFGVTPDNHLRFAFALDNHAAVTLQGAVDKKDWAKGVLDNVRKVTATMKVARPGKHVLRIYLQDMGVVLQKIVIHTDEIKPSYLGPPPSRWVVKAK